MTSGKALYIAVTEFGVLLVHPVGAEGTDYLVTQTSSVLGDLESAQLIATGYVLHELLREVYSPLWAPAAPCGTAPSEAAEDAPEYLERVTDGFGIPMNRLLLLRQQPNSVLVPGAWDGEDFVALVPGRPTVAPIDAFIDLQNEIDDLEILY